MAAELSMATLKRVLSGDAEVHLRGQILMALCGIAVLLAMGSVIVGTWQARADEQAALQRYADAEALLSLPPVDLELLEAERDSSQAALAEAKAQLEPPSVDPSADEATALLVERAAAAGLVVRGVTRVPATEATTAAMTYEVEGIRMTLEGEVARVLGFLAALNEEEPGVIPALTSLTTDEAARSVLDAAFNVYTEVPVATPVVPAGRTP